MIIKIEAPLQSINIQKKNCFSQGIKTLFVERNWEKAVTSNKSISNFEIGDYESFASKLF